MVRKRQDCSVLKTSVCHLYEYVIKKWKLPFKNYNVTITTGAKISARSSTRDYNISPSMSGNYCLKHFFV